MFEFNPHYRLSCKELIQNQIFDSVRVKKIEKGAPYKIYLDMDKIDSFDYEKQIDKVNHNINDLRR